MSTIVRASGLRSMFEVAPARPARGAGLRAAVATIVPLLIGRAFDHPELLWLGLAGFSVSLADKGGSYRTRAITMGSLAIAAALSGTIAALAGNHPWLAPLLMFVWGTATSLARAYGAAGGSVGLSTSTIFVVSLALPAHDPRSALARGALLAVGGAWAMLLSLGAWTVRPYRPARLAVARCYRELSALASMLSTAPLDAERPDTIARRAAMRAAIETARAVAAGTRRGRPGESGRGEQLLVLLELSDQQFGTLLALADLLESERAAGRHSLVTAGARALGEFARVAEEIASAIERERGTPSPPAWAPLGDGGATSGVESARLAYATRLVTKLRDMAEAAVATDTALNGARAAAPTSGPARAPPIEPGPQPLARLRVALASDSLLLQHSLRLGVTTALAVFLAQMLGLRRGYWVTLTVLVILQPYVGATMVKGVQRVAGTVLGGITAAVIAAAVHDARGILVIIAVLAVVSVALLPLNYGLYVVFLTPTFVLLAEVNAGDWHLAGLRIADTLLGGTIALVSARVLWPTHEWTRFPAQAAQALRHAAGYLRAAVTAHERPTPAHVRAFGAARRAYGLAVANAEASFQRLITETRANDPTLEAGMTLLVYARRLGAAITALGAAVDPAAPYVHPPWLRATSERTASALEDMADALEHERVPAPFEEPSTPETPPASPEDLRLREQLAYLMRQVVVMRRAVERVVKR